MRKVLFLKSSILGEHSQSNLLIDYAIANWQKQYPNDSITVRDLNQDNLPTLDSELLAIIRPAPDAVFNERQKSVLALSDALIAELKAHDTLVVGAPLYNYTVPTQLKNYFDLICRPGQTFNYTEKGPIGLLNINDSVVFKTSGGIYGEQPIINEYFNQLFTLIGIKNLNVIAAEGIAYGDEFREKAITSAKQAFDTFLSK